MHRPRRGPRGVLLLALCLGCGTSSIPVGERLIAEDPEEVLSLEAVAELSRVFEWHFGRPEALDEWDSRMVDGGLRIEDGALALRAATHDPQLTRGVDFRAENVHVLRVVARGAAGGAIQLFWSGPGQSFGPERSLLLRHDDSPGPQDDEARTFLFEVGSHPMWKGDIERLRIDPTDRPGQEVWIESISGSTRSIERRRLERLAADNWKIDLGSDVRNSFLGLPDRPREWSLSLPTAARLVFAWSLIPGVSIPIADPTSPAAAADTARPASPSLRISITGRDGKKAPLFERELDRDTVGWQDVSLDLSAYGGEPVVLRFEVRSPPQARSLAGLPVLSNPRIALSRARERPSIILVSLDTLRADRLGINGYPQETSPEIDGWARRWGVNFTQAIAQSPWTLPSHVSMLTGQNALTHGENRNRPVSQRARMMAEILRQAGYATGAFTGGVYLRPEYGFAQGFDRFRYWPRAGDNEPELEENLSSALAWIDQHRAEPFFLFLHTYEIHAPYRARQPLYASLNDLEVEVPERQVFHRVSKPSKEDGYASSSHLYWRDAPTAEPVPMPEAKRSVVAALYASGVAWADQQIGRLFRRLEELDLARQTVVVLTSDHGELLGEHGVDGHLYLWDENLRVPLIVSFPPRLPAGTSVSQQVRSIDILPTVLELVDLEIPPPVQGTSLVSLVNGDSSSFPRHAWSYTASGNFGLSLRFDRRLKYVLRNSPWLARDRAERLFDLQRDAAESENLVTHRQQQTRSLRARAEAVLNKSPGVQMELTNRRGEPLAGSISFPSIYPGKLTTPLLSCECLTWDGKSARFRIEPGRRVLLAIDIDDDETLVVRANREPLPAELVFEVSLESLDEPVERMLIAGAWRPAGAPPAGAGASIVLRRIGDRGRQPADPVAARRELAAELRALGYL